MPRGRDPTGQDRRWILNDVPVTSPDADEPQQPEPQAGTEQPDPQQGAVYQPYPDPHAHQPAQPRPGTVVAAFWIAVVLPVVATVLIAVSAFLMRDALGSATAGLGGGDPEAAELARTAPLVLSAGVVVFYAVLTALWVVFGFKLRAGRNWARVVLTVFAALWLVNGLGSVVTGSSVATNAQGPNAGPLLVLGAVQSALAVAGMIAFLVLVWSRRSQWFFAAGR